MKAQHLSVLISFIGCLLVLAACATPPTAPDPAEVSRRAEATIIAKTQMAELVEIAAAAANRQPYLPVLPTASFAPHAPLPTSIVQPPANQPPLNPTESPSLPAPSPDNQDCYRAKFVTDVTVTDNSIMLPGQTFVKTWRLVNNGDCSWLPDTQLVYVDGASMQGMSSPLGETIEPGQTVDISVQLTAPTEAGTYRGQWMLSNASGRFGLGDHGGEPFWVQVVVQTQTLTGQVAYKFAEHVCDASWRSAVAQLPCPGDPSQQVGFVIPVGNPNLESRQEDELGLWTHPNQAADGWIAGTYPPYIVQPGDHFIADVGCLADYPGCNVDFRIGYRPTRDENVLVQIGSWNETYDGNIQRIDVDLSSLAGQEIKLILAVAGFGPGDQNAAFWLVPQIRR